MANKLFGLILMAIGALIVGSAGLCTLIFEYGFAGSLLTGAGSLARGWPLLLLPIACGAFPIFAGVGVFFMGRRLGSPKQAPPRLPPKTFG